MGTYWMQCRYPKSHPHFWPPQSWDWQHPFFIIHSRQLPTSVYNVRDTGIAVIGRYKHHCSMLSTSRLVQSDAITLRGRGTSTLRLSSEQSTVPKHRVDRKPSSTTYREPLVSLRYPHVTVYVMVSFDLLFSCHCCLLSVGLPLIVGLSSFHWNLIDIILFLGHSYYCFAVQLFCFSFM